MPSLPSSPSHPSQPEPSLTMLKREAIKLKPPSTPVPLAGDSSRGLLPVTYHPVHGPLQQAPTVSLKNQKVLEEDEYMQALSDIIKRDFFPCLDQFESERQKYLDDRRRQLKSLQFSQQQLLASQCTPNPAFSSSALDQLQRSQNQPGGSRPNRWEDGGPTPRPPQTATPGMTPLGATAFADTPVSTSARSDSQQTSEPVRAARKAYDPTLSLDEFCSRYTSEDNSSFSEILNNANRLKRLKYAWAFDSSAKHNARLLESTLKREHLIGLIGKMAEGGSAVGLVEGMSGKPGERKMVENVTTRDERLALEAPDQRKLITEPSSADPPSSSEPKPKANPVTAIDQATAPALQPIKNPDSWPHVTRNALMFAPDADVSSHAPAKPPPFPAAPPVVLGGPKSINYASTRMANDDLLQASMKKSRALSRHSMSSLSPTRSQIAAAINGTPYPQPGSDSPRVNGFKFVPEMATPNADQLASSAELDQLMTWGEIMATPVRVSGDGEGLEEAEEELVEAGPFRICKTARREELAHGMAREASKSLRRKYGAAGGLGTGARLRHSLLGDSGGRGQEPESEAGAKTPRREMLSPAAKVLLKKTGLKHAHSSAQSSRLSCSSNNNRQGIFTPKRDGEQAVLDRQTMERVKRAKWDSPIALSTKLGKEKS